METPDSQGPSVRRFPRRRRRLATWQVQLVCVAGGLIAGLAVARATAWPLGSSADIRAFLFTVVVVAFAMISVIYSLLFLVVQFGTSTFSPRLTLFRHDPMVWNTFAYFLGLITFCMTAGFAIRTTVSVLVPITATAFALGALILIRNLQMRAFRSIQLATVLQQIDVRGRSILDATYPAHELRAPVTAWPPTTRTIRWARAPAVVQQIDLNRLLASVSAASSRLSLNAGVGDTIQEGAVLATIHGPDIPDSAVLHAVSTGPERTFDQDPTLAIRLIVDIALRSLSAALNDQATAVQRLDTLEGFLRHLAPRDLSPPPVTDRSGQARIRVPLPGWPELVSASFDEIVDSSSASPTVLQRLHDSLTNLTAASVPERTPPLRSRLEIVDSLLRTKHPAWTSHELGLPSIPDSDTSVD